ncbi:hypothetical protein B0H17DRAFT_1140330 [Mycena rosella]|uniref:Uncharacterized protein n=1 Tax=Mycena rosella TaxID=1033263 RepID=A0AAD7D228_MYCRO|nr:hypothetical protein B0H17DRAFT_1140330 [Mycena rosella]
MSPSVSEDWRQKTGKSALRNEQTIRHQPLFSVVDKGCEEPLDNKFHPPEKGKKSGDRTRTVIMGTAALRRQSCVARQIQIDHSAQAGPIAYHRGGSGGREAHTSAADGEGAYPQIRPAETHEGRGRIAADRGWRRFLRVNRQARMARVVVLSGVDLSTPVLRLAGGCSGPSLAEDGREGRKTRGLRWWQQIPSYIMPRQGHEGRHTTNREPSRRVGWPRRRSQLCQWARRRRVALIGGSGG